MSWFFETLTVSSEKNSLISAQRKLGGWRVTVDGVEQTGPETHEMWQYAFEKVREYQGVQKIRKILMLGLGAGGEVRTLLSTFKGATLTVVEFDPAMIELARKLKLHRPFPFPHVIAKDARDAVSEVEGEFDLIVVDLFRGPRPSPLAKDFGFLSALAGKLSQSGFLVVNVYRDTPLLMPFEKEFSILRKWRFRINNFGIFQKADVRDAFLKGYAPVRQWPELNTIESMPAFSHPTKLENGGVYWRLWPFSFEDYRTEHEPDVRDLPQDLRMPVRIIMWQRKNGVRAPQGWFGFSDRPFLKVGFVPVEPGYSKQWSETSLRELKRWRRLLAAKRYTCRRITYEEFSDGYLKSTLPLLLRQSMLYEVKVRMRNSKTPVTFFGAERISDGKIVAGLAVMESPELGISYYLAGFFKKQVQDEPVMAGLFDFWFQDGIARGLKFIDFGNFWKPGDESSWKGFSMFKAKFNPLYFFYPAKLYKFRWGK